MAVLRIADYLQLDANRAPTLLFHLKRPQSRTSIEGWNQYQAVERIAWDDEDPLAINVEVGTPLGVRTYLFLKTLLDDLQAELDTSRASSGNSTGRSPRQP